MQQLRQQFVKQLLSLKGGGGIYPLTRAVNPISFSFLDPDPGEKNLGENSQKLKSARKLVVFVILF